jgi:nicotinate phosphoribosyltransferase
MVYKLVAHLDDDGAWLPVGKNSEGKATVGGRKQPVRALSGGVAQSEDIWVEDPPVTPEDGRPLLVDLILDGEPVAAHLGPQGVEASRAHHAAAITELPPEAFSLARGEPVLPTRYL